MEGRTLMMLLALLTVTVVTLLSWRATALSRDCARHGGSYSFMDSRCHNAKPAPKVILQRDLMRT